MDKTGCLTLNGRLTIFKRIVTITTSICVTNECVHSITDTGIYFGNQIVNKSYHKPYFVCSLSRFSFIHILQSSWWRHQMETFSALLAICAGNSPVPGEFPAQRPVTRSLDVLFDLRLNKRLRKQSWGWWFGTLSHPLWRHCNDFASIGAIVRLPSTYQPNEYRQTIR